MSSQHRELMRWRAACCWVWNRYGGCSDLASFDVALVAYIKNSAPCGWARNGRAFERAGPVREEARGGFAPAVFYRSKFDISAALLQLCLCTACQIGPDHQVMK